MVKNSHWVLMVISIPDQTIKIYDSSTNSIPRELIEEEAMPFAHMVPYVLSISSFWTLPDGVPQAKHPYGDCGIYAVKFLECLVMGVAFADEHLRDSNMKIMRRKLAAEMYDETRHLENIR
ncbi:hypothetical protein N665_11633s0001 [Sinapis alba]|nr:hypothetical protein N665_11633s0001 [Sinapis alba]